MYKEYSQQSSPLDNRSRKCNEQKVANTPNLLGMFIMRKLRKVKPSADRRQGNVPFSHFGTRCLHPTFTILLLSCLKKAPKGQELQRHWIHQMNHRIPRKRRLAIYKILVA